MCVTRIYSNRVVMLIVMVNRGEANEIINEPGYHHHLVIPIVIIMYRASEMTNNKKNKKKLEQNLKYNNHNDHIIMGRWAGVQH